MPVSKENSCERKKKLMSVEFLRSSELHEHQRKRTAPPSQRASKLTLAFKKMMPSDDESEFRLTTG